MFLQLRDSGPTRSPLPSDRGRPTESPDFLDSNPRRAFERPLLAVNGRSATVRLVQTGRLMARSVYFVVLRIAGQDHAASRSKVGLKLRATIVA